ncbi:alpha/beta hydrolase [Chloroflexota bacterium]
MDLSSLDRLDILEMIFPLVYSPLYTFDHSQSVPDKIINYSIEVETGVNIHCGFWVSAKDCPSILYFHGNGETVSNYDWIAPFYTQKGINLFVAEYRGYGSSDGKPTISNMNSDTHIIFNRFKEMINQEGFNRNIFVMGRSLGSIPAVDLSFNNQDEICGLIIESGTDNNFRNLWTFTGIDDKGLLDEDSLFLNKVKLRQIIKPTLIIHGENDSLIPVKASEELYKNSAAKDKHILLIPGADHNNVMLVKQDEYFDTIEFFVKSHIK